MTDDFLSDEDKALFRHHMRSVKPLNEKQSERKPRRCPPMKKNHNVRESLHTQRRIFFIRFYS